jgi:hypothetical protein
MKLNRQLTQRIFLGSFLLLATLIAGCSQVGVEERVAMTLTAVFDLQPSSTLTATLQPSATSTPSPLPLPTDTLAPSATITETPTPSCLRLIEPQNGASLKSIGKQTFKWEPLSGASKYILAINPPPGHFQQTFESVDPSLYRWLNTIPWAGDYSWQVTAFDKDGEVLCVSGPFAFTKPKFIPTQTPRPEPPDLPTMDTIVPAQCTP